MSTLVIQEYGKLTSPFREASLEALTAALSTAPVRLEPCADALWLAASHHVGWIPFRLDGDSHVLVVVPKGTPAGREAESVTRFFDFVLAAEGLAHQNSSDEAGWTPLGTSSIWPVVLGTVFVRAMDELVKNDLRRGYRWHTEQLTGSIRGRLDVSLHSKFMHLGRAHHLPCTWEEYELDFLDNQVLKAALGALRLRRRMLAGIVDDSSLLPVAPGWIDDALATVLSRRIGVDELRKVTMRRHSSRYQRALTIASVLLRSSSEAASGELAGWTISAHHVFERLCARIAQNAAQSLGLRASTQGFEGLATAPLHLTRLHGIAGNQLKPDMLIHDSRNAIAIGDAKYKEIFEDTEPSTPTGTRSSAIRLHRSSNADLYQLFAYLRASRCNHGFFMAPYWDAKPGAVAAGRDVGLEYVVSPLDDEPVHLVVIGLNMMASAADVLREGERCLREWLNHY